MELKKVPTIRKDLTYTFVDYDAEGKPHWMIHDAARNKFFIIGCVEYELLEHWNLGDPQKILDAINTKSALQVDEQDLEGFANFLKNNYLIKQSGYDIHRLGKMQNLFKKDNWLHMVISYYLFFRIPIWHPDKFLNKTMRVATFVFSRYLAYAMLFLGILALYQISVRWETFTHTFSTIFTLQGLFFYFIAFSICKFCHEMGHAYRCKQFGVPVPSMGVAFLVFWPVLYTDTTLSWRLDNKKRMQIALAGIWVETYVTILAALIWCNSSNLTLQSICYLVISVNWLASLLINVSPFMRFDGYYVLADYLKMPNLQPRAFALTRWQIRHTLFGWQEPPPENYSRKMHYLLVAYSITTWLYRLVLYLGIAVLVYHFFIKAVGIILFAIEMFYFILGPIVSEIKNWYAQKDEFEWNKNTIATASAAGVLLLLFFLPIRVNIEVPGTISYSHFFLIAPENSRIENQPPKIGTQFKSGQVVFKLVSEELNNSLQLTNLEYQKNLADLRSSEISTKYQSQRNILLSEIRKNQAQYQKLYALYDKLMLRAPFDGVIREVAPDLSKGTFVAKNEWLADIIQPSVVKVEAFATADDLKYLKIGLKGYFYSHNISDPRVTLTVTDISHLNMTELNCTYSPAVKQDKKQTQVVDTPCYNANELGGDIPTLTSDSGAFVPVESVFVITLKTNTPVTLSHIERGKVVIHSEAHSYADRSIRWLKKLFVEQSGF